PRAKQVIEFAVEESGHLNHGYIGTEHLLLGLIRDEEGVAAKALTSLGLSLATIRQEVLDVLNEAPSHPSDPPRRPPPQDTSSDNLPPLRRLSGRMGQAYDLLESAARLFRAMTEDAVARQEFSHATALLDREAMVKKIQEWLVAEKDKDK